MQQIQTPNILGNYLQGREARREVDKQNFLAQAAPALMQGDPRAVNMLAQYDPQGAMQMMQNRQQMQAREQQMQMQREQMGMDRERMGFARQEAARQAQQFAAEMDAQERQDEAQRLSQALQGAAYYYANEDQDGYYNHLRDLGVENPQEQYPFEAFPALAPRAEGVIEALTTFEDMGRGPEEPTSIQSLRIRAQEAGLEPGTDAYKEFMRRGGTIPKGMAIRTTPDGGMEFVQGEGVDGTSTKFTEGQSKDNVYATRARGALEVLEPVAGALVSRGESMAELAPLGIGREFQSEDYQVAKQAGDEFLQAILRKDTGAAITEGEQALYGETYLPRPGDSEAVLEAKRQSRIRALNAIEAGMSPGQIVARDRALVSAAREGASAGGNATNTQTGYSNTDFQSALSQATDEEVDMLSGMSNEEAVRFLEERGYLNGGS